MSNKDHSTTSSRRTQSITVAIIVREAQEQDSTDTTTASTRNGMKPSPLTSKPVGISSNSKRLKRCNQTENNETQPTGFINFTSEDGSKLMTGVAISGQSKPVQCRRRKLAGRRRFMEELDSTITKTADAWNNFKHAVLELELRRMSKIK